MATNGKHKRLQEQNPDEIRKTDEECIAEIRARMGEKRWADMMRRVDAAQLPPATPRNKRTDRRLE